MRSQRPVIWIDLGGAAVTAGLVLAIGSYAATPLRQRAEKREVMASCAAARNELADAQAELDRVRKQAQQLRDKLREVGSLPKAGPRTDAHERLAALASRCRIKIISFVPAQDREYPGLVEKRLAFEAVGKTEDILRFLKAVENDESWLDIGFLRIASSAIADARPQDRALSFGVSLFSATEPTAVKNASSPAPQEAVSPASQGRGS